MLSLSLSSGKTQNQQYWLLGVFEPIIARLTIKRHAACGVAETNRATDNNEGIIDCNHYEQQQLKQQDTLAEKTTTTTDFNQN
jgi:hypothetical protein